MAIVTNNTYFSRTFSFSDVNISPEKKDSPCPMTTLPSELLDHIFSLLTPQERLTAALVCKLWAIQIFGDVRNQLSLEKAKTLPSLRIHTALPSFLMESARWIYHINLKMAFTYAKNLEEEGIDPSPFPNVLFTSNTLSIAYKLEDKLQEKKDLALCRFYEILCASAVLPNGLDPERTELFDFSEVTDFKLRAEKIKETLHNSPKVKALATLELKPSLEEIENLEFRLPEELALFTSLTELRINGELLCRQVEDNPVFLGSLRFPHTPDCLTKLQILKISFFKEVDHLPKMPSLLVFYLNGCRTLTAFPKGLEDQHTLQKLVVNCCSVLETIPDIFDHFSKLHTIAFTLCLKLAKIPPSIGRIQSLTHIEIVNCKIFPSKNDPTLSALLLQIRMLPLIQKYELGQTY